LREQIISIRRKTSIFNRFILPQKDIVGRLIEIPELKLTKNLKQRLQESHNDMTRFVEDLQTMRERAHSIQNEVGNILTERLNRNTYVFSIIASIFLPLSFLTGLLGINVLGIPGADDPRAFLIFCGILVAIMATQILVFRKLRWF
jgi:zinc transporter